MAEKATLTYKTEFDAHSSRDDYADVDISTDGGSTWTNLLRWDSDHLGGETVTLDLTPYAGSIMSMIRFHYYASGWCWWWMIDDVVVTRTGGKVLNKAPKLKVSSKCLDGRPGRKILERADDGNFDMIIMGSRGLGGMGGLLLGSVSRVVVHGAKVPVTVVK